MFSLQVDGDTKLALVEEVHADVLQEAIERNREHLGPWMRWVAEEGTRDDLVAWIRLSLQRFVEGRGFYAAIWHRGKVAGTMGLEVDTRDRTAEIGYWVDRELQGQGLVTRSARAVLGVCFDELRLHRVEIQCASTNARSRAVAERLGFREEGTRRGAERVGETFHDLVVYGMLANERP